MQRMSPLAWACLAIGSALATPLTASATYQDRFSMAGSGAAAAFGSCEPSPAGGQVCTAISIGVASQITKADGTKTSETTLSIDIGRFSLDSTGAFTFISETAGFGVASLSVSPRLSSATAAASFQVITCSVDNCADGGTVTVSASWTGQGDLIHDVSNVHFSKDPFSGNFHANGDVRSADATATVNGTDFGASLFASMFNVKTAAIFICHMC